LQSLPTDSLGAISGMMASNGVQQLFLVPELEKMKLPVRVLFGRQDRILRWQEALNLPGKIALHLFDTGHMLHWEDPSAVLPVLAGFPVGG
jgi:pimeloyl-ACP methyl ester carboxylesterase